MPIKSSRYIRNKTARVFSGKCFNLESIGQLLMILTVMFFALQVVAQDALASVINPTRHPNFESLLLGILVYLQQIIGVLAVVFIVIGGIMYMVSGGNIKRTEQAKRAITAAIVGLAIVFAAPSFLKTIYVDILGSGLDVPEEVENAPSLIQIAMNVLNFLLSIAGTLAVLSIVYGGITYLTAAVDTQRAESAKKIVTYAAIGIIIVLLALTIVKEVATSIAGT